MKYVWTLLILAVVVGPTAMFAPLSWPAAILVGVAVKFLMAEKR